VIGGNVQKRANGVLVLMAYSVVPDLAGSSLSINSASTGNPGIVATQFGGGSLLGEAFPAYVEGFWGFSRYDPTFIASNGQEQRVVPTKWNTFAGTGGVGWDFSSFETSRLTAAHSGAHLEGVRIVDWNEAAWSSGGRDLEDRSLGA
jgi:hypothetical protein